MRSIVIIPILVLIFVSCENIDNSTNNLKTPEIPANDSIDIDNDSRFDFVIEYSTLTTDDEPPSSQSIIGQIRPLYDNQVLYRESVGYLFLQPNDTIRRENNTNSKWNDYGAELISIDRKKDNWDKEWTIMSDLDNDFFLGIKLKGDNEQIGWILLHLNTKSGDISVMDIELTYSSELIIEK